MSRQKFFTITFSFFLILTTRFTFFVQAAEPEMLSPLSSKPKEKSRGGLAFEVGPTFEYGRLYEISGVTPPTRSNPEPTGFVTTLIPKTPGFSLALSPSFLLFSTCQVSARSTCMDLFVQARFALGHSPESQGHTITHFQATLGFSPEIFFGNQRLFALGIRMGFGYDYTYAPGIELVFTKEEARREAEGGLTEYLADPSPHLHRMLAMVGLQGVFHLSRPHGLALTIGFDFALIPALPSRGFPFFFPMTYQILGPTAGLRYRF